MKLTIIPIDGAVYIDGASYSGLAFGGVPTGVHALQWHGDKGWVEYIGSEPNEDIVELPPWAHNAVNAFVAAKDAENILVENTPLANLPFSEKMSLIRQERNKRIAATDWVYADDVKALHSAEWLASWGVYRQELRDVPAAITADNVNDLVFPLPPNI